MRIIYIRTLVAAAAILVAATIAAAQTPASSGASDSDGWKTVVYPIHGWLPIFTASSRIPESGGSGGIGGDIVHLETSSSLDNAWFAGFRVERARLSVEGNFLWAGLTGSVRLPSASLTLDTKSLRLKGGFEVAPALYLDAGVRRLAIELTASVLDFEPVEWKPGVWQPIVGATYRPQLGRTLRLITQVDLGWGDASRSASAVATLEWKPVSHFLLGGGWGVLYVRADGTVLRKDVHLSQTLNGPMLAIGIPF